MILILDIKMFDFKNVSGIRVRGIQIIIEYLENCSRHKGI